jgi:hypothetical protein
LDVPKRQKPDQIEMAHRIFTGTFEALEAKLLDSIVDRQKQDPLAPDRKRRTQSRIYPARRHRCL